MPSIEIICVGQQQPLDLPRLPFAVQADPARRFGNPDLRDRADAMFYFAHALLSEESRHNANGMLQFDGVFCEALARFTTLLLAVSPEHRIVFTSDWQFGPSHTLRVRFETLGDFWHAHDRGMLRLNALYDIGGPAL